jgi:hypothetical protein
MKRFFFAALAALWVASGVVAQEAVSLDEAISGAVSYLREKIPAGSKVAVLSVSAPAAALSAYIVDELSERIVNGGGFVSFPLGQTDMGDSFRDTSSSFDAGCVFGLAAGGSAGIRLGPGNLFADFRYMADIGNTTTTGGEALYNRGMVMFGLGYEIALF